MAARLRYMPYDVFNLERLVPDNMPVKRTLLNKRVYNDETK